MKTVSWEYYLDSGISSIIRLYNTINTFYMYVYIWDRYSMKDYNLIIVVVVQLVSDYYENNYIT